jgi:hypothetical protein
MHGAKRLDARALVREKKDGVLAKWSRPYADDR